MASACAEQGGAVRRLGGMRRLILAGLTSCGAALLPGCQSIAREGAGSVGREATAPGGQLHSTSRAMPVSSSLPRPRAQADYALFDRFPGLRSQLPRIELASLPTPVATSPSLARELGVDVMLVKRDELSSPVYGGGKVRKLELLLADARARGFRRVVTSGGVGSHHALATALFGRRLGFEVRLLLLPQPASEEVRITLLASQAAGATLELGGSARSLSERAEPDEYVLPPGGSSPHGNLGFVNAGLELVRQLREARLPEPDALFVAMGTMGSAVGLAIGLELAGAKTRVVAVRASNRPTSTRAKLDTMLDDTWALLSQLEPSLASRALDRSRLIVDGSQLGRGYAQPTDEGRRAAELYRRHLGGELDSTYTAKAFAALMAWARFRPGGVLMFYNTHNAVPVPAADAPITDLPVALRSYAR